MPSQYGVLDNVEDDFNVLGISGSGKVAIELLRGVVTNMVEHAYQIDLHILQLVGVTLGGGRQKEKSGGVKMRLW